MESYKFWKRYHADRQEFKYRIILYTLSYILGYNEGILGANANMEVDNTPDLEVNNSLTGRCRLPISNVGV